MKSVKDYVLPEWLKNELDEPIEPMVIDKVDDEFVLVSDGEVILRAGSFEEIYDSVDRRNQRMIFSDAAKSIFEDEYSSIFMISENDGSGSSRIFTERDDPKDLEYLEEDYLNFRELSEKFKNELEEGCPTFMTAWEYVGNHPLFWQKNRYVLERDEKPFASSLWITEVNPIDRAFPVFEDDGSVLWIVEGGSTVRERVSEFDPPAFTHRYFDPEITGVGATIEEALINFAKNVFETGEE